jgi:DNA-binding IclR family transcriptional regulator
MKKRAVAKVAKDAGEHLRMDEDLDGDDELISSDPDLKARRGIQSLDAALLMLRTLASFPTSVSLTELARAANLPTSKAHRYLASFLRAGLAVQQGKLGRYDLGPLAVKIGLASLGRNDFVNRAADGLEELSASTGLTALLAVWGTHGATIVRWERSPNFTITSFGLGSTLPLLTSSSGRIFLSFLPRRLTAARFRLEMEHWLESGKALPDLDPQPDSIDRLISRIRTDRISEMDERVIPGLFALSAPVTNWQGEVEVAVSLVGTSRDMLVQKDFRNQLSEFTRRLSIERPKR